MVLVDSVWPLWPRHLVVVSALGAHHRSCSRQDHHTLATWYCCCNDVLFSQLFLGIAPTLGCGAHSVLRPPLVVAFPLFCLVLIPPPTPPSRSSLPTFSTLGNTILVPLPYFWYYLLCPSVERGWKIFFCSFGVRHNYSGGFGG